MPAFQNLVAQINRNKPRQDEPAPELLRLRGEVTRLRHSYDQTGNLRKEIDELRSENQQLRETYPSLNDVYILSSYDKNSLPEIGMGASKDNALAELQEVGARVVTDMSEYIEAEVFPDAAGNINPNLAPITMRFYFEDGKLTSRKDS